MAALGEATPRAGVLDLYRSLWAAGRELAQRYHLAIWVEAALVIAWFVLRTESGVDQPLYQAWAVVVGALSLVSPTTGLVIIVAIAPFDEPFTVSRVLGVKHILILVVGLSVLLRVLARPRAMRWSVALGLGIAMGVATALGVAHSYVRFGPEFGGLSAQNWLGGIGGAMIVLVAAAWVARSGGLRPLAIAIGSATVAGYLSLADYLNPGLLEGGRLGWLLADKDFGPRLTGVIASPNGVAALLIAPTAFLLVAAALAHRRTFRVAALLLAGGLVVTLYYTYSRAPLLALFATAVLIAWRIRRALGIALVGAGLVVGLAVAPAYLQLRDQTLGSTQEAGQVLIATDVQRITAWEAAGRMWLDSPLIGHGFRSYKELGASYGDPILNSPHNEWIRLFAEEGIVAGVMGLVFVLSTVLRLWRAPGWLTVGIAAAFTGFVLAACFNNPFLFIQVGVITFTIVGTGIALGARPAEVAVNT